MLKKTLFIILFTYSLSYTQDRSLNLDSLYQLYVDIKQGVQDTEQNELSRGGNKCAFGIVNRVRSNYENFTLEQQQVLNTLFQRPVRQKNIISPRGYFLIHYNTTGTEVPKYIGTLTPDQNAMLVAEALDSSYNFEINHLGYPPPKDNGMGGNNLYDVYIVNTGSGYYGYTEFETEIPGTRTFYSFMVIDNDYAGFYSSGIEGAMVTVAHELHHGIQMGNYIYRESDLFYYEASSTAMEEFVYDSINDYYAYMSSYFQNPYLALPEQNGYNLAHLNIFLEQRFDHNLLKRIWELMPEDSALFAINRALIEKASSFENEYHTFGVWTYFTGQRSLPGKFFEEAVNYPLIRPLITLSFSPPEDTVSAVSKPTGNNFIYFLNGLDTLVVLISNADITSAVNNPLLDESFRYALFNYPAPGSIHLTEDYFINFMPGHPGPWHTTEILNSLIVRSGDVVAAVVATDDYARYPGNTGQFTISRTGNDTEPLTILFTISGTAIPGEDYTLLPTSIEIPSGKSVAVLTIDPLEREGLEDRKVVLTLEDDTTYIIGTQNEATILIDFGDILSADRIFPSPYRYSLNTPLNIPLNFLTSGTVEFNVFSTGMERIYSNTERIQIIRGDISGIVWNVLDNDNKKLATGVYLFMIKSGDNVKKGKLLILND